MTDRILRNNATEIDELVLTGVDLHIEQLDSGCWWICASRGPDVYWSGNFTSKDRLTFTEQENSGVVWDRDETHEGGQ